MRFLRGSGFTHLGHATRVRRSALAMGLGLLASAAFLFDCGGSSFSGASAGASGAGAGAGGIGQGGATAAGATNGGSAGANQHGGASAGGSAGAIERGGSSNGGSSGNAQGGAGEGGESPAAGAGGVSAAGSGGMVITACPTTAPSGACAPGLMCSYGDDLRLTCRSQYECVDGSFIEDENPACQPLEDCIQRDGGAVTDGHACPTVGEECSFDAGQDQGMFYCRCQACAASNCTAMWDCVAPPAKPCPTLLPNIGQPCGSTVMSCAYGLCSMPGGIATLTCDGHTWQQTAGGCVSAG